jgi:hypothetical protein
MATQQLSESNQNMPDYFGLANLQSDATNKQAGLNTLANRPNQVNARGATSNWVQGPDGQWTQNISMAPQDQAMLDQQRGIGAGLLGGMQQSANTPYDLNNTPQGSYDTSNMAQVDPNQMSQGLGMFGGTNWSGLNQLNPGFGAVQQVSDAMMGRMAPQLAQGREAEIQRLKNQGLTEGSEAFQRAMTRLDQSDTDARQQALLGGMGAYGDIFSRGLAGNQQEIGRQFGMSDRADSQRGQQFGENQALQNMLMQLRGQQFGEQTNMADLANRNRMMNLNEQQVVGNRPFEQYAALNANAMKDPTFGAFMGATPGTAPDYQTAANQIYQINQDAGNKKAAQSGGMMSGLFGLGGAALGGMFGGPMGAALGSKLGSSVGGMIG